MYGEIALTASSQGAIERIRSLLRPLSLNLRVSEEPFMLHAPRQDTCDHITIYRGNLSTGFRSPAHGLVILSETELLGTRPRHVQQKSIENRRA